MSCLFISLSHFIPNVNPNRLRNILCQFLSKNPKLLDEVHASQIIKWEKGMSLIEYINFMSRNSSWGGAIEIKAFCTLYKVNVLVSSIPNKRNIEFIGNPNSKNFLAISWTGNHYEPLKIIEKR